MTIITIIVMIIMRVITIIYNALITESNKNTNRQTLGLTTTTNMQTQDLTKFH